MASVQQKGNGWHCQFMYRGRRRTFALGEVTEAMARSRIVQVEEILRLIKQGRLPTPDDVVEFVKNDGKPPGPPDELQKLQKAEALTLAGLLAHYRETHQGVLEERTLKGIDTHLKPIIRSLGEAFAIRDLTLAGLQGHVDRRKTANGPRGPISPATIKKEVHSLRAVWNWGARMGHVAGRFPYDGLRYPKADEKPPFMTRSEIERQVAKGGLGPDEVEQLWGSLYLRASEIDEFLALVSGRAIHPWVYPLVVTAAHTGARRSELIRMRTADVDFEGEAVTIRERKRVKGKRSTRRAPLTPLLKQALEDWLAVHPGGSALFCHAAEVSRSKKRSRTTGHEDQKTRSNSMAVRRAGVRERTDGIGVGPLTVNECHNHFKRTLSGTKWSVVRGLHVLRHSFISALAAGGVDQRIIDDIVGHTSEEVRRRYRHLTPESKHQAVAAVFGNRRSGKRPSR